MCQALSSLTLITNPTRFLLLKIDSRAFRIHPHLSLSVYLPISFLSHTISPSLSLSNSVCLSISFVSLPLYHLNSLLCLCLCLSLSLCLILSIYLFHSSLCHSLLSHFPSLPVYLPFSLSLSSHLSFSWPLCQIL